MKKILACLFLLPMLVCLAPNQAKALSYDLSYVFSGVINTAPPYATITLTQLSDGVQFDLKNLTPGTQVGGSSKLTKFYFNYKGGSTLTFSDPNGWDIDYSPDNHKADGDGYFDFLVDALANNYLATNSTQTFIITGDNNINNFFDLSVGGIPGEGNYYFAAHIQALSDPREGSAWVGNPGTPIPEPATMLLLGSGLLGLAGVARRRFKK